MYVIHEIERYEDPFLECGYIDVGNGLIGGDNENANEGPAVNEGNSGGDAADGAADGIGLDGNNADRLADVEASNGNNADGVDDDLGTMGDRTEISAEDDSDDEEFVPSEGNIDSADDVQFTNSEDEYDDESGFEEQNAEKDVSRVENGKGVAHEAFSPPQFAIGVAVVVRASSDIVSLAAVRSRFYSRCRRLLLTPLFCKLTSTHESSPPLLTSFWVTPLFPRLHSVVPHRSFVTPCKIAARLEYNKKVWVSRYVIQSSVASFKKCGQSGKRLLYMSSKEM
ncbi:hypothetical protein PIB30_033901 [Stylosanthes scabra]|uniref:Uncharacterized protein n=1 Tax=Stylosanthes scabra TaxID=79078 RepID=A0ABU6VE74_9FABA|nr:hypothetical protein [Stylosanthes scabra]